MSDMSNFTQYDKHLWYMEYQSADRRYILGFSQQKQQDERIGRQNRLDRFEQRLKAINSRLAQAKRNRKREALEKAVEALLKKTKMKRAITVTIDDLPIVTGNKTVNSFLVSYSVDANILSDIQLTDGLTCFYTNTNHNTWPTDKVIRQYREKNVIEEGFHEIKGLMELRPVYLSLPKRVRAHVTICVLAYLLYNTLEKRVSKMIDASAADILTELEKCKIHTITTTSGMEQIKTLTRFSEQQLTILKHLEYKPKSIEGHFRKLVASTNQM
jgi:transposase